MPQWQKLIYLPAWSNVNLQLHGQTSTSQHHGQTSTSQHHGRTSTSQHHGRTSTKSFSKFSKFSAHLFWAWCHLLSRSISCLGFLWQWWLSYPYLPTPPFGHNMTQFKQSLTGLNSIFLLLDKLLTKAEELSLPYYLPIAGGRIIGFIPFPKVLVLCEMQSASSRIWTRIAVSISHDDNHYTTDTSKWWLSYPLCVSVKPHPMLCTWTLNPNSSKPNQLNDKI